MAWIPAAEYSEIIDPDLQVRVRDRYRDPMAALRTLGFLPITYVLEALGNYSAIFNFPILLMAMNKEVIVFRRPLRLAVANALLSHSDPPTIALCMGMGVKLYTAFGDGTLLISSDFKTYAKPRPGSFITRLSPFSSINDAWRAHADRVASRVSTGVQILHRTSFYDYVNLSKREEDPEQYS